MIDITKKWKTKSGTKVLRIEYAPYPLKVHLERDAVGSYTENGRYFGDKDESTLDLIEDTDEACPEPDFAPGTGYETDALGPVVVLCVDAPGGYPIKGYQVSTGFVQQWRADGSHSAIKSPGYQLRRSEVFERGDRVMALYADGSFCRRYYSHRDDSGRHHCYARGRDAWTLKDWPSHYWTTAFERVRRPTPEELELGS